ncbi:MAG: BNR repeat-containing protein [Bacteroidales bacterium]|nr:BNR repeat-containing protein [Bacteroidales bacterium]
MNIILAFHWIICLSIVILSVSPADAQRLTAIGEGWSNTSVNTVIFRKNSVVTHKHKQFTAFYDSSGFMILAKRRLHTDRWTIKKTSFQGDVKDAHNSISIMTDGRGCLHIAWNHHNDPLNYVKSTKAFSLDLTPKIPMTGEDEKCISYPEFYRLPDGDLIFMYRSGASGSGNLSMNRYSLKTEKWSRLHDVLIDGENERNAYWQACIDKYGTIHLSWVWRESPDVASNHDLCYANSDDGGITWKKSDGTVYTLPITSATAEYACRIPQKSGLINQTSMTADSQGRPYIVTYWSPYGTDVPQYFLVYRDDGWKTLQVSRRTTPFSLSGGGTKKIPVSRPQVIVTEKDGLQPVMIFRDTERQNRVSLAVCKDLSSNIWEYRDLTGFSVGDWEPTYDSELWRNYELLHIFVQKVGQGDAEQMELTDPQPVYILEWKP